MFTRCSILPCLLEATDIGFFGHSLEVLQCVLARSLTRGGRPQTDHVCSRCRNVSPFAGRRRHVSESLLLRQEIGAEHASIPMFIRCKDQRVHSLQGSGYNQPPRPGARMGHVTKGTSTQTSAKSWRNFKSGAQALRTVTNARRMSRAQGHRVTNLSARHKTTGHVEGTGEQKSNNSVRLGRTYRDKNTLQILKGDAGEFRVFVGLEDHQYHVSQHQLKKRGIENRERLSTIHTLALFLSKTSVYCHCLVMNLLASLQRRAKRCSIWPSSEALAWRTNTSADFRTARGLLGEYQKPIPE